MCVTEYTIRICRIGLKHGDISFVSEKEQGQSRHTKRDRERVWREGEGEGERDKERASLALHEVERVGAASMD